MPHVRTFGPSVYFSELKLPIYKIILSAQGSKRGYHLSFYQSQNRCHVSGQILSLSQLFILIAFPRFWFYGQWSSWGNCFWVNGLLTMTLWPHSLPFHVQVMILMDSYGFFNQASTSVVGCYLYIIIHNSMSWWDWGIGLAPLCGRSAPKSLKAIDSYTYNKSHIDSLYVGLWVC